MSYLNIQPEDGKWYISEGFKSCRAPGDIAKWDTHNRGRHKMILAGPFTSNEEAETRLLEYASFHGPHVWCCDAEKSVFEDVQSDVEGAIGEPDYTAVNTLWLGLLKLANEHEGRTEKLRMEALTQRIPEPTVREIMEHAAIDLLLDLDPPLETVLSHPHERLNDTEVREVLGQIRDRRAGSPREALSKLGVVLKTIRNKREHGFNWAFAIQGFKITSVWSSASNR